MSEVEAVFIDPVAREVSRVRLPVPSVDEGTRMLLVGAAVMEGAGEREMVSASSYLKLKSPLDVNAYTVEQHNSSRYVLMVGDMSDKFHVVIICQLASP